MPRAGRSPRRWNCGRMEGVAEAEPLREIKPAKAARHEIPALGTRGSHGRRRSSGHRCPRCKIPSGPVGRGAEMKAPIQRAQEWPETAVAGRAAVYRWSERGDLNARPPAPSREVCRLDVPAAQFDGVVPSRAAHMLLRQAAGAGDNDPVTHEPDLCDPADMAEGRGWEDRVRITSAITRRQAEESLARVRPIPR